MSKRGFASMTPEKQREIASRGGKAAHAQGTAHEFTSEDARAAGRKGGKGAMAKPGWASYLGSLGGRTRAENARARRLAAGAPVLVEGPSVTAPLGAPAESICGSPLEVKP